MEATGKGEAVKKEGSSLGKYHSSSSQRNNEEDEPLSRINLRELREKNRQTESAIRSIETKIQYMKNKEEKTVKKVLNIKRKLTNIENVRSKSKGVKNQLLLERQKEQEEQLQKTEFNKLIKDHLKYNKKIVMTLMNHKVSEEAKSFKEKNTKLEVLAHIQQENLVEENIEKANKVRMDHLQAHERRKMYFLDKLHQFKGLKESKLREEVRERERQEQVIAELEERERALLDRLSVSERFRLKCQQEYEDARAKYKSFYEASRGISRGHRSCDQSRVSDFGGTSEGKADIFIS